MKDQRFLELVNLYIDRQISAAETAELEAEIQSSPRRRAVYKQYCQMHRATTMVYESFRAGAADQQPVPTANKGTIAQFESERRSRRSPWTYYAGGLAAAACLGLVFMQLNSKPAAEINLVAVNAPHVAIPASSSLPEVRTAAMPLVEAKAGLVSLRNSAAAEPDYAALVAALRQEEQRGLANGQLPAGRLPSLFEDGVFDSQQVMPAANQRTFRGKQSPTTPAEFTAFQFQR
jgi:hypothetical protein